MIPNRTFEKHLRLVSRAASQRLGILRKSMHPLSLPLTIGEHGTVLKESDDFVILGVTIDSKPHL